MKKKISVSALGLFSLLLSFSTFAQETPKTCNWISPKGYWVVESNKQTPRTALIYFYNNDHVLVYKEEITNQKLKLNKKKTLYRLKAALEEAIELSSSGAWVSKPELVKKSLQD